ncbi:MAG TPA: hypothetical protein VFP94_03460, partial [Terriglobales bacterium]|nr:hypothetical protein [Terriglobales bacterium]
ASALRRRGGRQQAQPPGCAAALLHVPEDGSAAAPDTAGTDMARGAASPQAGQGCGSANSASG